MHKIININKYSLLHFTTHIHIKSKKYSYTPRFLWETMWGSLKEVLHRYYSFRYLLGSIRHSWYHGAKRSTIFSICYSILNCIAYFISKIDIKTRIWRRPLHFLLHIKKLHPMAEYLYLWNNCRVPVQITLSSASSWSTYV